MSTDTTFRKIMRLRSGALTQLRMKTERNTPDRLQWTEEAVDNCQARL